MRLPERIIWTALIGAALAAARYMPQAVLDANLCLFKRFTSLECPLCGMVRSMHSAARGDLSSSLTLNPMGAVLVIVLLAMIPILWRGGPGPALGRMLGIFLVSGFIACWLLRILAA